MFRLLPILTVVVIACIGGCNADSADSSAAGSPECATACPLAARDAGSMNGVAASATGGTAAAARTDCADKACDAAPECDTPECPPSMCDEMAKQDCQSKKSGIPGAPKASD